MLVGLLVASCYSPVLSTAGLCRDPDNPLDSRLQCAAFSMRTSRKLSITLVRVLLTPG